MDESSTRETGNSDSTGGDTSTSRRLLRDLLSRSRPKDQLDYARLAELTRECLADDSGDRGRVWRDQDSAELEALLTQYRSLRSESLNTITNRIQVMLLGLGVVGAFAGGALTIEDPATRPGVVLAVFTVTIPLLSVFVLMSWLSEAARSARVGRFLAEEVESSINLKLGAFLMRWEHALWSGHLDRDEFGGPSMWTMALFGLIGLLSPMFGRIVEGESIAPVTWLAADLLVPWGLIIVAFFYTLNFFR